jgi:predicted ester cyclase
MKHIAKPWILFGTVLFCGFKFIPQENNRQTINQKEGNMTMIENTTKNKEIIRKLYEESLNTGNFEMMDQVIGEEFTFQNAKGPSAYKNPIGALRQGFPDIKWTIDEILAEGDKVAVKATWRGTHTGQFRTYAPTNKKTTNGGIAIYQFKNGKIVGISIETDRLGFFQQLGIIPEDLSTLPKSK